MAEHQLLNATPGRGASLSGEALAAVSQAVAALRFGEIRLVIHDGSVVQLDVTERTRFARS